MKYLSLISSIYRYFNKVPMSNYCYLLILINSFPFQVFYNIHLRRTTTYVLSFFSSNNGDVSLHFIENVFYVNFKNK